MTASPAYPTICMYPNHDGVNDGEWFTWYDSTVAFPTPVTGRSVTGGGGYASIYSSGQTWPYAWSISSSDSVGFSFRLSQFGTYRHPKLSFRAKRSNIITGYVNNYLVGVFNGSNSIGQCVWGPVSFSWQSTYCSVTTPYNQQLNYSGGWNGLLLSITGDGFGGAIDLLDVNYLFLTIEP
jgi:hypothetical protein